MGICTLIVNPSSGGEKATGYLDLMRTRLSEMFEEVTVKKTKSKAMPKSLRKKQQTWDTKRFSAWAAMAQSTKPSMAWRLQGKVYLSGSFRWAPSMTLQER